GDAVGYGPEPNECLDLLRNQAAVMVMGNHDSMVAGKSNIMRAGVYAREVIGWTRDVISIDNLQFLQKLPLVKYEEDFHIVHATPREPGEWNYIRTRLEAARNFRYFNTAICLTGHSHEPQIIELTAKGAVAYSYRKAVIKPDSRFIVNAGSVGQPRDGIPEASYIVIKNGLIEIKRVAYDILVTQKKMQEAGLPSYLISRLSTGK
ncbi:metallophosphoesterase family protein, partial [bacterium]|nr:metallophosphoesterase family protein [bacterium]